MDNELIIQKLKQAADSGLLSEMLEKALDEAVTILNYNKCKSAEIEIVDNEFRFDRWLKKELYERCMMQKELAEISGVSCGRINQYIERNEMPTLRTLDLILKALDMHIEFVQNE